MALIHNAAGDHTLDVNASGEALVKITGTLPVSMLETQQVINRSFYEAVAHGLIPSHVSAPIDGYNAAAGTAYEPIWAISGASYPWLTTAAVLTVSSNATTDVYGSGTGAWVVLVEGLDANWVEQSEYVNLNGRNAVSTVNAYLRINAMTVVAAGTNGSNNGALYVGYGTVTTGVPASILSAITATENVSSQIVYSVPAGKHLEMVGYRASMSAAGSIQFRTRYNPTPGVWWAAYTIPMPASTGVINALLPIVLPEKTDFMMVVKATSGSVACGVIVEAALGTP